MSEQGNVSALRGALEKIKELNRYDLGCIRSRKRRDEFDAKVLEIERTVRAALSLPARNCDVGTADEQAERFENFCLEHIGCAEETGGRHCVGCPLENASRNITQKCDLYWAQMPFAQTKGGDHA